MKTIEIKLYEFEELSLKSQGKAIENDCSINVTFDWWEYIYEDSKNISLEITSFDLDRNKDATGKLTTDCNSVANDIIEKHGEKTETFEIPKQFIKFWNDAVKLHSNGIDTEKVENEKEFYFDIIISDYEEDFLKHLLNEYSNILQRECEYQQSEEAIKETSISNEYDFTEDGKRY
jgi:hypothetical protein